MFPSFRRRLFASLVSRNSAGAIGPARRAARKRLPLEPELLERRTVLSTISVTTTADSSDPGDGVVSLREAIDQANVTPGIDTIVFDLSPADPGHRYYSDDGLSGVTLANATATSAADDSSISDIDPDYAHSWWTIQPTQALPVITDPIIIDGYSQSGAQVNTLSVGSNAVLRVELDMSLAGPVSGLEITAGNSSVQGLAINRHSRNDASDSAIHVRGASGSHIWGNYIGTDISGTRAPTSVDFGVFTTSGPIGVQLSGQTQSNFVGSNGDGLNDFAERNVISGNDYGVALRSDILNVIDGNYIGTDASGSRALGNWMGVTTLSIDTDAQVRFSHSDQIQNNVISGNTIGVGPGGGTGAEAVFAHQLTSNLIGTDATGAVGVGSDGLPLGNRWTGVALTVGMHDLRINQNTIAYNGWDTPAGWTEGGAGVWAVEFRGAPYNNRIQGNSIHSNVGLGIDLGGTYPFGGPDGLTPADSLDADGGPNQLQNAPTLSSAAAGSSTRVKGGLDSTPNSAFTIDVYADSKAASIADAEGETHLGSFVVVTDSSGVATFDRTLSHATSSGDFITATATDFSGNTSEFSLAAPTQQIVSGTAGDDQFVISAAATPGAIEVTRTNSQGTQVIELTAGDLFISGLDGNDTFVVNDVPAGILQLEGNGGSDVFELNAATGGAVVVMGHAGSDQLTVNASPAAGLTADLGEDGDQYTANFGNLQGTVNLNDSGLSGTDQLLVNGTSDSDFIQKIPGQVSRFDLLTEAINYSGIEDLTIDGGDGGDSILDPGENTTLLGGDGDDTIIVTATVGSGVVVDGEAGFDTIIVELGALGGTVTVTDSGAGDRTALEIVGTDEDDHIQLSTDGVTSGDEQIALLLSLDDLDLTLSGGAGNDLVSVEESLPPTMTLVLDSVARAVDIETERGGNTPLINVDSRGRLNLALLSTETFDVADVDLSSVEFAGARAAHSAYEDVDGDGRLDLVFAFQISQTHLRQTYTELLSADLAADDQLDSTRQSASLALTGQTSDGNAFAGSQSMTLFLSGRSLREVLDQLLGSG